MLVTVLVVRPRSATQNEAKMASHLWEEFPSAGAQVGVFSTSPVAEERERYSKMASSAIELRYDMAGSHAARQRKPAQGRTREAYLTRTVPSLSIQGHQKGEGAPACLFRSALFCCTDYSDGA